MIIKKFKVVRGLDIEVERALNTYQETYEVKIIKSEISNNSMLVLVVELITR